MSKKSVFCLAASRHQADQILDHLRSESFSKNDISVLFSNQDTTGELTSESINKAPAGAVAGAGTDSFSGDPLGWMLGAAVLPIPGLGAFGAAGPIVSALSASAEGGIVGGLMGLGIPEAEAKRYEAKVKDGSFLISVNSGDVGDIARAKDIFQQVGARDICTPGEPRRRAVPRPRFWPQFSTRTHTTVPEASFGISTLPRSMVLRRAVEQATIRGDWLHQVSASSFKARPHTSKLPLKTMNPRFSHLIPDQIYGNH